MKRLFQILILSILPIIGYCQYANDYYSQYGHSVSYVSQKNEDIKPVKPVSCDIYAGYSFGYANKYATHGMNIGVLYSYNYVMLGCDFKISLSETEIDRHSWGGYAVFGAKYKYIGIGAMIGGCSIYNDYYISNYYYYYDYNIYNPYATYKHYRSISKFDGGIIIVGNIPFPNSYGVCIALSYTYYTPISLSIGFTLNNY